jgi:transcriptional repressor NF-X1
VLKCDEECARLERNRKLASALNVDPNHADDHVPYSAETLALFSELNPAWTQAQEKAFRTLAADPDSKRLRFKPAPKEQRRFIHLLAEDFGFDSESMDPEPHRHVAVFKTPRFVAAPMKTLLECQRLRRAQSAAVVPTTSTTKAKASNVEPDPYNAFLLTNPRFGLTINDLSSAARSILDTDTTLSFTISFLPSEEVVIKADPSLPVSNTDPASTVDRERNIDRRLTALRDPLAKVVASQGMGSIQLARVDSSLNVLRRESDGATTGGWSQVAAKAARSVPIRNTGINVSGNAFGVLGGSGTLGSGKGKVAFSAKKKEKRQESVVDDWEAAEAAEEERERLESGNVSGVESVKGAEEENVEDEVAGPAKESLEIEE